MGRGIEAGRVWTNCYHQYPAHAAFGGYKISGVGRENHRMMLDHCSQTKCLLASYDRPATREARPDRHPPVRRLLRRLRTDVPDGGGVPPGPGDVELGDVAGVPFLIDADLHERLGTPGFTLDVAPGSEDTFSLEGMEGLHFTTRVVPG